MIINRDCGQSTFSEWAPTVTQDNVSYTRNPAQRQLPGDPRELKWDSFSVALTMNCVYPKVITFTFVANNGFGQARYIESNKN